jgi:hypothetical protein
MFKGTGKRKECPQLRFYRYSRNLIPVFGLGNDEVKRPKCGRTHFEPILEESLVERLASVAGGTQWTDSRNIKINLSSCSLRVVFRLSSQNRSVGTQLAGPNAAKKLSLNHGPS